MFCHSWIEGWPGLESAARNPGASFAPLSPAPATRSLKAVLTEHLPFLLRDCSWAFGELDPDRRFLLAGAKCEWRL